MFSTTIDGQEIGKLLKITNVDRSGLAPVENTYVEYTGVNGSKLKNKVYRRRPISSDFVCVGEIDEKWELVKKILSNEEQFKIVFGDFPDRYFIATTEGDTTFNKVSGQYANGTISLSAPYPFAKAVTEKEAQRDGNKLTFVNEGTATAFPRFEFTADRDYKMFGFTHPDGNVAQFGYASNQRPFINTGQRFIYDTFTNEAYIIGGGGKTRVYLSEGRGFSIKAGRTTEVGLTFPESNTQVVRGYLRSEYV